MKIMLTFCQKIKEEVNLSLVLAKTDFKSKNEGSYLGILWYLINPLLMFALLLFIFSDRLGNDIPYYSAYMLLGIIMFNFFQNTTIESTAAIIQNGGLIKSINFPKEILVWSTVFKNIFSHFFEIGIFLILLLFLKIPLINLILYLPILILLSLFISGLSFLLAALNIKIADLSNIWVFGSRLIWLGTPLFYSINNSPRLLIVNLFNPMYYFITLAREIIIYSKIPAWWLIFGALVYTLLSLITGLFIFKRLKNKFAELV